MPHTQRYIMVGPRMCSMHAVCMLCLPCPSRMAECKTTRLNGPTIPCLTPQSRMGTVLPTVAEAAAKPRDLEKELKREAAAKAEAAAKVCWGLSWCGLIQMHDTQ